VKSGYDVLYTPFSWIRRSVHEILNLVILTIHECLHLGNPYVPLTSGNHVRLVYEDTAAVTRLP
jgi:hypothetical protein